MVRMANLYANVAQTGALSGIAGCLDPVTASPARQMNLAGYGIEVGYPADIVILLRRWWKSRSR